MDLLVEGPAREFYCIVLGVDLPPPDDPVAVKRIKFAQKAPPSGLVGGNQCGARTTKQVQNNGIAAGDVLDGIGDHRHGLHRGMQCYLFIVGRTKGVHALVGPDIGPVPAMLAQLEAVDVRPGPLLEGKDQLVPRAVEGPHAASPCR